MNNYSFCPNCNRKSKSINKLHSCGHIVCTSCFDAHLYNCWWNGREPSLN